MRRCTYTGLFGVLCLALLATGCATTPSAGSPRPGDETPAIGSDGGAGKAVSATESGFGGTPWLYRSRNHRTRRPRYPGQKPVIPVPSEQRDGYGRRVPEWP